jgi:AAA domain
MLGNGQQIAHVEEYKPHWRFTLQHFNEIRVSRAGRYLVQNWIPREGLVIVWGPPKCGKSFWIFDIVMHVALGWNYRRWRVQRGTVVYVACEGEHGFAARIEAFRQGKIAEDGADPSFYLLPTRLDLAADAEALATDIEAQLGGQPCSAIVIDTLNRSLAGSESRDEDMSAYIQGADRLREKFRCAMIVVHHCGRDDQRPRGHTSLTGAGDAQIAVKRSTAGNIIAEVEHMKDGPSGELTASRLSPLDVDIDDHGEAITSCIIEPTEDQCPAQSKRQRQPSLPAGAKIALKQLKNAISAGGEFVPEASGVPANTMGVNIDLWRRYSYQGGISTGESPAAKRNAFLRATEKLIAEERVGKWGEWVWIAPQSATL